MAHNNQWTKAAKAKRSAAAKRAWVTIRANKAAASKAADVKGAKELQKVINTSAAKIAAKAA
jgi:hypothetical protein